MLGNSKEDVTKEAKELMASAYTNAATCFYRQGNYYLVLLFGQLALNYNPKMTKASFRMAQAYFKLGGLEEAKVLLEQVLLECPGANLSNPGSLINNFWDNGNGGDGSNWSPFLNFIGNSNKIAVVASPPLDKPPKIHYAYSGLDTIVKYFSCAITYKNNGKVASETCSNPATVSASILSASAPGITMMSDGTLVICYAVVNSQANCFTSVDGITFTPKGMAAVSLGAPAPYSIGTSYNVVIRNIFQFSDMKASGTGWSFSGIPPGLAFNSDPVSMVIKAAGVSTIILVGIGYDGGIYWTKKNLLSDNFTPMIKLTSTTGIALGSPTLLGINPSIDKQSYTGVRLIVKFVNSDGYSYITFDGSAWTTTWLPLNKKRLCSDLTSVQVGSSYRFYGYDEKKGAIYTWDAV